MLSYHPFSFMTHNLLVCCSLSFISFTMIYIPLLLIDDVILIIYFLFSISFISLKETLVSILLIFVIYVIIFYVIMMFAIFSILVLLTFHLTIFCYLYFMIDFVSPMKINHFN